MLKQLYIKNFTLIDTLDIELRPGFSVITGETGAGKSIILGAIGLLLGQRADTKSIKHGCDKCIIEAHFDLSRYGMENFFERNDIEYDASDCIVRRELTTAGKSRAFINDTPIPLALLKELGEQLIDVHSQHQNLLLSKQDFQLEVIDILANSKETLKEYRKAFSTLQEKRKQLSQLEEEIARNQQNADFLQFQFDELESANLQEEEQEELEQQRDIMEHSEDIKTSLYEAQHYLDDDESGILLQLNRSISTLSSISKMLAPVSDWVERLDACRIDLKDITEDVEAQVEMVDFDPAELETTNQRLDLIYHLQKKHHKNTVSELIELRDQLNTQLNTIIGGDEALDDLRKEIKKTEDYCILQADKLSTLRKKAAKCIIKEMHERLIALGMPKLRFDISITPTSLNRHGSDDVAFLFSANTSSPLQPIAQVASGGEIARIMLSLKAMISGAVKLPTIIFDEIDTGVSGKIAERMAEIMQEMGNNNRQVISITHLPQIAALGTTHYRVSKQETPQGTVSQMQMLSDEERVNEIAQMLSGNDISEAAVANARQLLKKQ